MLILLFFHLNYRLIVFCRNSYVPKVHSNDQQNVAACKLSSLSSFHTQCPLTNICSSTGLSVGIIVGFLWMMSDI